MVGTADMPAVSDRDADGYDDNVLAVVVNITVIEPSRVGYLRAFPAGADEGDTSVINYPADTTVPNTAVMRPGVDGEIAIRLVSPLARAPRTSRSTSRAGSRPAATRTAVPG